VDQPVIWGAPQAERVDAARNRLHLGRSYIGFEGSYAVTYFQPWGTGAIVQEVPERMADVAFPPPGKAARPHFRCRRRHAGRLRGPRASES
jgi:hypothetical protein